ncbi:hypothetical protein ABB37_03378 [Leptomonas pyrrhocoris]|uniref:Uncharacterized protein n=1 Tax=Leptomonas pyrrhocoris TaxID=157538 RepID=A0A0M9G4I8_LEPPY|nr:hypothetical protein ABB37_03378 [Leptomonas pyrrhocoris]KPA82270.1 hypothetical protein ABB37_03378 [Leptomonas pyrrhocoris]|eukprot:XP_015660709.1 hypothetical protein ABB37_03378 [Leptomonas pyrrhocoris]
MPFGRSETLGSDGRKSRLRSAFASGIGICSSHGISQSPLVTLPNSGLTSAIAPSTLSDAPLSWRVNSFARGATTAADAEDELGGNAEKVVPRLSRPVSSFPSPPVSIARDDSCVSSLAAEDKAARFTFIESEQQIHHATTPTSQSGMPTGEQMEGMREEARVIANSSSADVSSVREGDRQLQRPVSRRPGEVGVAERALFQENDIDDDAETEEEEGEVSSIVGEKRVESLLRLSNETLHQPTSLTSSGVAVETILAHTPQRPSSAEVRAEPEKSMNASLLPSDISTRGGDGSSTTLNCTRAPDPLSSSNTNKQHNSLSHNVSLKRHFAVPSNSALTVSTNSSVLSATVAESRCIANVRNRVNETNGGASAHRTATGKTTGTSCASEDERTPSDSTVKLLPADVQLHAATPTVTGCGEKTPMPTPIRRDLLCHLLTQAASATLHTPRTASPSFAAPAAGASTQTPTPHPSRRLGSSTPSWEGHAQITGFPTPVKLSPIPTKAYALYAELTASTTRARGVAEPQQPAVPPCTPPRPPPSPTLSSISSEDHLVTLAPLAALSSDRKSEAEADAEAVQPCSLSIKNGAAKEEATIACPTVAEHTAKSAIQDEKGTAQPDASCRVPHSTSSECSVSPIRARADQTTRVWMPQPGDDSPVHLRPLSSASCVSFSHDGAARLAVAHARPISHAHLPSVSPELVGQSSHADSSAAAHWTASSTSQQYSSNRSEVDVRESTAETARQTETPLRLSPPQLFSGECATTSATQLSRQLSQCIALRRSALSPDELGGYTVAAHKPMEPALTGRISPRLFTDTLNLGTPSVSMIHSPAQAMNESCSFLLSRAATPYIQALPIPGMRSSTQPSKTTGELGLEKKPQANTGSSLQSDNSATDQLLLRLDGLHVDQRARKRTLPPHAPLISPALGEDDVNQNANNDAEDGTTLGTPNTSVVKLRHRKYSPILSPPFEAESCAVDRHTAALRENHGTQTSCAADGTTSAHFDSSVKDRPDVPRKASSTRTRSHEAPLVSELQKSTFMSKNPLSFSLDGQPQSSSHSWNSVAVSHRYQRLGLSSLTEGGCRSKEEEGHHWSSRHSVAAKSLSSTRFIDSWL